MKECYPPVNVKFTYRIKYYDCFSYYRENDNDTSIMTELIEGYAIYELKQYIEITEQSDKIRNGSPENYFG